jgi:hypothetical protein
VVDTNTLYADAGGNRVGIGTTAPSSSLHIVDSISTASRVSLTISNSGSATGTIQLANGNDGSASYLASVIGVSELQGFGAALIGKVGPANDADNSFVSTDAAIVLAGKRPDNTALQGANILAVNNNNTNLLLIDKDGKVGISTTFPSSTLHVVGSLRASASSTFDTLTASSLVMADASKSLAPVVIGSGLSLSGNVLSAGGASAGTVSTSTEVTTGYVPVWGTTSALTGTSTVFQSGSSIGIGTTAPSTTLHVLGTLRASATTTLDTGSLTSNVANGATAVGFALNTANTFSTSGAKITSFRTGGTEKAYVDKDGVLGVAKIAALTGVGNVLHINNAINGNHILYSREGWGAGLYWTNNSINWTFDGGDGGAANVSLENGGLLALDATAGQKAATQGDSGFTKSAVTGGNMSFKYDGTEFFRMSGGGVNIATSTLIGSSIVLVPSSTLHVVGTFQASATTTLASSLVVDTNTLYADAGGNKVGVGTTAPSSTLHVVGTFQVTATSTFSGGATIIDDLQVGASIFEADAGQVSWMDMPVTASSSAATVNSYTAQLDGNPMLTVYGLSNGLGSAFNLGVGVGTTTPAYMLHVFTTSSAVAAFERGNDDGTLISLRQGGVEEGTISVSGTTISYNAFTGSHYGILDDLTETMTKGTVIVLTGNNSYLNENTESEILYGITKSTTANSPAVMGSYLAVQEPTKKNDKTNPVLVMAVGNGDVWVADNGHNVAVGDYLITSDVDGHAMKDLRTTATSYVFARASEPINWADVTETFDGVKHKKIAVFFESFARDNAAASALALQDGADPTTAPEDTNLTVTTLTVNGSFLVKGPVTFNKDTAGQAKILKNAQSVQVVFAQTYATLPIVNITPIGTTALDVNFKYALTDVSTSGFTIQINNPAYEAVTFNWTAFASASDAQIFVSDGTQSLVNVTVVAPAPAPEIVAPEDETDSVTSDSVATEDAGTTAIASAIDSIVPAESVIDSSSSSSESVVISEQSPATDSASSTDNGAATTESEPTTSIETSGSEPTAPVSDTGEAVTPDSGTVETGTAADNTTPAAEPGDTGASDGSGSTPPAEGGVSGTPDQGSSN